MKTKIHYRQGDVLIQRIASIPDTAVKQKAKGRIILAHGEVTGHHHSLAADSADWWKLPAQPGAPAGDADEQFLEVKTPAQVTHQEHGPIDLPAGTYRVLRQREYSPQEIRRVED